MIAQEIRIKLTFLCLNVFHLFRHCTNVSVLNSLDLTLGPLLPFFCLLCVHFDLLVLCSPLDRLPSLLLVLRDHLVPGRLCHALIVNLELPYDFVFVDWHLNPVSSGVSSFYLTLLSFVLAHHLA